MKLTRRLAAPLGAFACCLCSAAVAAPDCSAVPPMSPIQKRIAVKAGGDTDELRRFVAIRSMVYRFDVHAVMEQGVGHHQWLASCARAADTRPVDVASTPQRATR